MSFGNGYNGGRTRMTTKVLLNVYDLSPTNDYLYPVGMGLHHSGVEISGREYSYSDQGGIYDGPPRQAPNARFRCQIDMGTFDGGTQELNKALDELRHNSGFGSNGYNLIRKNCNHFCNALVWQLLRKPIPAHVNRLANIGDCCSCLLPKEMLSSNSPVGTTGGSDNQPSSSFGSAPYRSPMNRGTTGSGVSAFAGTGYSLNGGSSASSSSSSSTSTIPRFPLYLTLSTSVRLLGGIDRQNRVGSKFGGGGVSSSQNAERERKERLKQLALESIDLAKDPYLMRNHLGTYECKLCLTLHTNEANYLAHTQGKKHQAGLAKRAHMEKLRARREETDRGLKRPPGYDQQQQQQQQHRSKTIKIGRPAYQVFKSRDGDTNQRCLTFELTYRDIREDLRPRHRFMSAFEQKVDLPKDKRYQYVLFAAEPYETIAFKIPNEPLDKDPGRLITHWDGDDKKFTVTLYFADDDERDEGGGAVATEASAPAPASVKMETDGSGTASPFAPALGSR